MNPTAYAVRNLNYTFNGETDDTVSLSVRLPFGDQFATVAINVNLPTTGWTDADVLDALQAKLPQFTVAWE